jgi:hypothetical protein
MRITITRTIDVPDDLGSVNALETLVREAGFTLMRELVGTLWQRLQEQSLRCPHCGSQDVERRGHKAFELLTAFGSVELPRRRVKCRACKSYGQPMDKWLGELGDHRTTWLVQELTCLAAASWPYGDAEVIVERMLLGAVSHEQIRRVANAEGERVAEELEAEAQTVLEAPVFDEGEEDARGLNVVLDGDWVKSRDNPEGMEAKVGVVYTGVERIGKDRRRLVNRRYAATFKGSDLLGKLVYAQASKLGVERVGRLRLLGDGAKWIDTIGDEHFARAKRVLDLWHLERQLSRGLKAAIGDKAELARQRAELGGLIRTGQVEPVLARLRALAEQQPTVGVGEGGESAVPGVPAVPKELSATITYVEGHRHAIIDYQAEQAAGEHVGSGAVEKAGDVVVNRRLKGRRGMRWWRQNADGILALRILHLNRDWDAYWRRRREPQPTAA